MPETEYTEFLTDKDKLLIYFNANRGRISIFIVQYYALIDSRWRTIMRIDNRHGYPHKHTYYLHKKEYRVKLNTNDENSTIFNEAKVMMKRNFRKIKENYLRTR